MMGSCLKRFLKVKVPNPGSNRNIQRRYIYVETVCPSSELEASGSHLEVDRQGKVTRHVG